MPHRLSRDLASRVLDRAASIDAAAEPVDIETLRAAAFDAGISPEAFERALAETAPAVRETPLTHEQPHAYDVAVKASWVGLLTGAAAIGAAMVIFGPDDDALAGATIGGIGALVGVFVHLLARFRKRSR
jgi:hypothetical protein